MDHGLTQARRTVDAGQGTSCLGNLDNLAFTRVDANAGDSHADAVGPRQSEN